SDRNRVRTGVRSRVGRACAAERTQAQGPEETVPAADRGAGACAGPRLDPAGATTRRDVLAGAAHARARIRGGRIPAGGPECGRHGRGSRDVAPGYAARAAGAWRADRSEERRVGKEGRARWVAVA